MKVTSTRRRLSAFIKIRSPLGHKKSSAELELLTSRGPFRGLTEIVCSHIEINSEKGKGIEGSHVNWNIAH